MIIFLCIVFFVIIFFVIKKYLISLIILVPAIILSFYLYQNRFNVGTPHESARKVLLTLTKTPEHEKDPEKFIKDYLIPKQHIFSVKCNMDKLTCLVGYDKNNMDSNQIIQLLLKVGVETTTVKKKVKVVDFRVKPY